MTRGCLGALTLSLIVAALFAMVENTASPARGVISAEVIIALWLLMTRPGADG